ncbi:MAG: hypothetical protein HC784_16400, partial [Hydrococcus sp. CSU_1_8]|nr:hypothetical protein [Hydrococcus sp. CSU_1_8]
MLNLLVRKFTKIATIVLLVLGVAIAIPSKAQADTVIPLDSNSKDINVVTVYSTTAKTQSQVLSELAKAEQKAFSSIPGFQDSAILKAQDGTQVIALSQWKGKDLS